VVTILLNRKCQLTFNFNGLLLLKRSEIVLLYFGYEEVNVMGKIKVKCPNGHEFYIEEWEKKACPKCGRVVIGPKAK
jgi:hypothetical protein